MPTSLSKVCPGCRNRCASSFCGCDLTTRWYSTATCACAAWLPVMESTPPPLLTPNTSTAWISAKSRIIGRTQSLAVVGTSRDLVTLLFLPKVQYEGNILVSPCDLLTRAEVPLEVLHLPDEHPAHRQARVVLRRAQDRLEELPRHLRRHRRTAPLPVAVPARWYQ